MVLWRKAFSLPISIIIFHLAEKQFRNIWRSISDVLRSGWHLQSWSDQWVARKVKSQWFLPRGLPRPGWQRRGVLPSGQRQIIFEVRVFFLNWFDKTLLLATSPLISVVLFSSISKKRQQSRVSMASSMRLMRASGVTARQTPQTGVTTQSQTWVRISIFLTFFGKGAVGQNNWNWALVFWLKLVTSTT